MVTTIIIIFIIGYLLIALENFTKVNKSAIALILCVICWILFSLGGFTNNLGNVIERNLGEASTTLFFLMGAMTIVEIVDQYGGFNFVKNTLHSKSKKALLWKIGFMTFILSAVLDNLTTSIVMIMILRKLVNDNSERIWYSSLVIIAANAGGAFSPIGDVTTIMLWNGHMITATGVIRELLLPSIFAFIIPTFFIQYQLKGKLQSSLTNKQSNNIVGNISKIQRNLVFFIGVGGLCSVPIFHTITGLPAFVGVILVLGILWVVTEIMYWHKGESDPMAKRVAKLLSRIDMTTILFFLGILMAVSVLSEIGVLSNLGKWFDVHIANDFLVTGAIGILSSVVDNVPLVAGAMKMYVINPSGGPLGVDGIFWQLLAYCAGTGGSMLIIGSAAGVVVMGLEKISFGWYMKHITPLAVMGYLCGIVIYWLMNI